MKAAIDMIETEEIVRRDLTDMIEIEETLKDLNVITTTEVNKEVVLKEVVEVTVIVIVTMIVVVKAQVLLFAKVHLKEVDLEVDREEAMIIRLLSLQWLRDQCSSTNRKADPFSSQLTT